MPEGDTIFHLATSLRRVLEGRTIVSAYSGVVEVDEKQVVGASVEAVTSRGKNLLITLSTGTTLHCHLMMNGYVRAYRRSKEDAAGRPRRYGLSVRGAISTVHHDVVFYDTPVLRLLRTEKLDKDPKLARVGPDPLREAIDPAALARELSSHPKRPLGEALLDQRVMAGLGNVLKSETMFCAGADPFAPVSAYTDSMLAEILATGAKLLETTTDPRVVRASSTGRRITRVTDASLRGRASRLWVYERAGRECFVCGSRIRVERQGLEKRSTFWCPECQPPRTIAEAPLLAARIGPIGKVTR